MTRTRRIALRPRQSESSLEFLLLILKTQSIMTRRRYANMIMSQGQALKKRTQELEAQAAAACSERDVMKQQLEEVRAQAAASSSLHVSQLKAKSNDVQRMEEATEQLRATYVKRFKKLEDALQQVLV